MPHCQACLNFNCKFKFQEAAQHQETVDRRSLNYRVVRTEAAAGLLVQHPLAREARRRSFGAVRCPLWAPRLGAAAAAKPAEEAAARAVVLQHGFAHASGYGVVRWRGTALAAAALWPDRVVLKRQK